MACHLNLEAYLAALLVVQRGLIAGREIGERHIRFEARSILSVQCQRSGVSSCGDRVALILLVVIVSSIQSVAVGRRALV